MTVIIASRQARPWGTGEGHAGLSKLYWRMGKPHEAHEHLTTATTMYREMDMPFWLEQAEAEMRGLAG
jgi:hypothetical protein